VKRVLSTKFEDLSQLPPPSFFHRVRAKEVVRQFKKAETLRRERYEEEIRESIQSLIGNFAYMNYLDRVHPLANKV